MARHGASRIVILARRQEPIDGAVAAVAAAGGQASGLSVDLTAPAAVTAAANTLVSEYGVPDIVVYSAASGRFVTIEESAFDDVIQAMASTYFGAYSLVHALLPGMLARGSGHIVFVGSPVRAIGFPAFAYKASRHALCGFAEALAEDFREGPLKITYCEPARIVDSNYWHSNAGVEQRLPIWARDRRFRSLWQTSDEAGDMIADAVLCDRPYASPLWQRLVTRLLPYSVATWSQRIWSAGPDAGGFPIRRKDR
jgi:NAD(P)-dependent dehydrogenase (short-subunit alcohol dehydrogenase family)